ncbi:hypothetical protein EVAR_68898_1, partial [Eumeta japonica]
MRIPDVIPYCRCYEQTKRYSTYKEEIHRRTRLTKIANRISKLNWQRVNSIARSTKKPVEESKERKKVEWRPQTDRPARNDLPLGATHDVEKVAGHHWYLDTLLHIFKANIGSGLLAMGDAFKNGGLVFATIMTAFLGVICVHAQHQL